MNALPLIYNRQGKAVPLQSKPFKIYRMASKMELEQMAEREMTRRYIAKCLFAGMIAGLIFMAIAVILASIELAWYIGMPGWAGPLFLFGIPIAAACFYQWRKAKKEGR